jgi:hypothetical protein
LQKIIFIFRDMSWKCQNVMHSGTDNHRRHRDISLETKMNCCNIRLFAIQILTVTIYILHYAFQILFKHLTICILTLLLHIYDITSHYSIFLCWIPPWRWLKKAETCRRFTTRCISLYLIIAQLLVYIYIWWLVLLHWTWIILNLQT